MTTPVPFTPAAAPPGSPELEAYHYGRAAAYHTTAELVARLPGPEARELATRVHGWHTTALEATDAAFRARPQVDQARAAAELEPEDGGDPATELYWRRVEQAAARRGDTDGAHAAHRRRWEILGLELAEIERQAAPGEPPELGEDETEDERATVVLDGLRAALGGPGAWEADPAHPGALIGEIGGVLVRVQAVAP